MLIFFESFAFFKAFDELSVFEFTPKQQTLKIILKNKRNLFNLFCLYRKAKKKHLDKLENKSCNHKINVDLFLVI